MIPSITDRATTELENASQGFSELSVLIALLDRIACAGELDTTDVISLLQIARRIAEERGEAASTMADTLSTAQEVAHV
jgi:hypothetical protein